MAETVSVISEDAMPQSGPQFQTDGPASWAGGLWLLVSAAIGPTFPVWLQNEPSCTSSSHFWFPAYGTHCFGGSDGLQACPGQVSDLFYFSEIEGRLPSHILLTSYFSVIIIEHMVSIFMLLLCTHRKKNVSQLTLVLTWRIVY